MHYMTLPFLLAIVVYHDLYNSTVTDVQSTLHTAAVLEDKCYISLQQDKTYNQKDMLYFFLMFVNKPKYRTVECSCNNVAPVTYLCLGRATTRSHSSQWSKKKVAVET